jgi:hypothetical protein
VHKAVPVLIASACLLGSSLLSSPSADASRAGCNTTTYYEECVYFDGVIGESKVIDYRDSVYNGKSYTIQGECVAEESTTHGWKISIEISTSLRAPLFASFDAKVGGEINKSVTTKYGAKTTFDVKKHDTVNCDRGVTTDKFKGRRVVNYFSGGGGQVVTAYTAWAPIRQRWWVY